MTALAQTQKRAAIYCRVSSSAQEEDGASLDTQEASCRAHAEAHGYQIVGVWREVYTGAKYRERPALSDLRARVRSGEADVVLAHALDRLSRNQAHLAILAEEANEHGAALEFVTEDFEDSAVGRFIRSAKAFAAEVEREKIGERSVRGKVARIQSGRLLPGGRPLYGYHWRDDVDDKTGKVLQRVGYEIDELTGPIVRRMFAEAMIGTPIRTIARRLHAEGIPTPRGGTVWHPTVIHSILRHPSYTGEAHAWAWRIVGTTKTKVFDAENAIPLPPGTVPPLVDRATWDAVQHRLARNKAASPRRARDPEGALLRGGHARCGYCGKVMRVQNRTRQAPVYQCGAAYGPEGQRCRTFCIAVPELDGEVWQRVRAVLIDPDVIGQELARLRATDPTAADLAPIDRALSDVKRRQANLTREISATDDPDVSALLRGELAGLSKRKRELEAERATVEGQRARWEAAQDRLDDIARWCGAIAAKVDGMAYADKRLALDALGVEARVWATGHHQRWDFSATIPLTPSLSVSGPSSPSSWSFSSRTPRTGTPWPCI